MKKKWREDDLSIWEVEVGAIDAELSPAEAAFYRGYDQEYPDEAEWEPVLSPVIKKHWNRHRHRYVK